MKKILVHVLFFFISGIAWADAARGYFGYGYSIEADGFFWDPTLQSVTITKIAPASPAAKAGILEGDQVLELEGRVIAGAKGNEISALSKKQIGQTLRLRLKHVNGELYFVAMIAIAKP